MTIPRIGLCFLLGLILIVPTQVFGLSYNAKRRVKAIRFSLKYLQRRYKAGRLREVRKRWNWSVEKRWVKFAQDYPGEVNDPIAQQLKRDIFSLKKLVFPKGAVGQKPVPTRRTVVQRRVRPQPRRGARRVPAGLRWGRAKLSKLEGNMAYVKQSLSTGQFRMAARTLSGTEDSLKTFLGRPMYRKHFSARHPRVVRLRQRMATLWGYVRAKKKWTVNWNSCNRITCSHLTLKYAMSCPRNLATTPNVQSVLERDNLRFMKALNRFTQARKVLGRFFRKHPNCCRRRLREEHQQCQRAQAYFQTRWKEYLKFIQKCRNFRACVVAVKRNNHPMLRLDVRRIRARIGSLRASAQRQAKVRAARIARTHCPPQIRKYANARIKRGIRGAVYNMTRGFSKTGYVKRVGKYSITSRPYKTYNRWKRLEYQSVAARVCMKNIYRKTRVNCRAYNLTMRRVRRSGGRWGRWRLYSVGSSYGINCKTYR